MFEPTRRKTVRAIILGGGLIGTSPFLIRGNAYSQERWLITADEREASMIAGKSSTRGFAIEDTTGDDPTIDILLPKQNERIVSPVDFDVRFRTRPPASIVPGSVRILYGSIGLNITSRILGFGGRVTAEGITLNKAPLQADTYRITVEVSNSERRLARRTVRFRVE